MIYINEYTGERFASAAECDKSEKAYVEAKKKAEEKARADKAKREAEKKKREEEEKAKKQRVADAYKKALEATDKAAEEIEAYFGVCEKEGYHACANFNVDPLIKFILEM
jgi:hypothetical protein